MSGPNAFLSQLYGTFDYDDEPQLTKEAAAQLEEADILGRAMAHAYVNELGEIEKQAGWKEDLGEKAKSALEYVKKKGGDAGEYVASKGRKAKAWAKVNVSKEETAVRKLHDETAKQLKDWQKLAKSLDEMTAANAAAQVKAVREALPAVAALDKQVAETLAKEVKAPEEKVAEKVTEKAPEFMGQMMSKSKKQKEETKQG